MGEHSFDSVTGLSAGSPCTTPRGAPKVPRGEAYSVGMMAHPAPPRWGLGKRPQTQRARHGPHRAMHGTEELDSQKVTV